MVCYLKWDWRRHKSDKWQHNSKHLNPFVFSTIGWKYSEGKGNIGPFNFFKNANYHFYHQKIPPSSMSLRRSVDGTVCRETVRDAVHERRRDKTMALLVGLDGLWCWVGRQGFKGFLVCYSSRGRRCTSLLVKNEWLIEGDITKDTLRFLWGYPRSKLVCQFQETNNTAPWCAYLFQTRGTV